MSDEAYKPSAEEIQQAEDILALDPKHSAMTNERNKQALNIVKEFSQELGEETCNEVLYSLKLEKDSEDVKIVSFTARGHHVVFRSRLDEDNLISFSDVNLEVIVDGLPLNQGDGPRVVIAKKYGLFVNRLIQELGDKFIEWKIEKNAIKKAIDDLTR